MGSCSGVRKMNLYNIFKKLDIKFEEIEHEPVFTIEQAQAIKNRIHPNTNTKPISITYDTLIKFIEFRNHNYMFIS